MEDRIIENRRDCHLTKKKTMNLFCVPVLTTGASTLDIINPSTEYAKTLHVNITKHFNVEIQTKSFS